MPVQTLRLHCRVAVFQTMCASKRRLPFCSTTLSSARCGRLRATYRILHVPCLATIDRVGYTEIAGSGSISIPTTPLELAEVTYLAVQSGNMNMSVVGETLAPRVPEVVENTTQQRFFVQSVSMYTANGDPHQRLIMLFRLTRGSQTERQGTVVQAKHTRAQKMKEN